MGFKDLFKKNEKTIEPYSPEWIVKSVEEHPKTKTHFDMTGDLNYIYRTGEQEKELEGGRWVDVEYLNRESTTYKINARNIFSRISGLWVSKFCAELPFPKVTPDDEEMSYYHKYFLTKKMNVLLGDWWERKKLIKILQECVDSQFMAGYGVVKLFFNSNKGKLIIPKGVTYGLDGYKEVKEDIFQGDIDVEIIPTRDYFPDPTARKAEDRRWVIIRYRKPTDAMEEKFDLKSGKLSPDSEDDRPYQGLTRKATESDEETNESVTVYELLVLPCRRFPNGLRKLTTKKEILFTEEFPGDDLFIYDFRISHQQHGVRNLPICPADIIRPIQRSTNKANAVIEENIMDAGHSFWSVKEGTKWGQNIVNGMFILKYSGDIPPRREGVDPLPQHIDARPDSLYRLAFELLGLTDAGAGKIGRGMSQLPTSLFEALLNTEKNYFSAPLQDFIYFIQDICRGYFKLAKKYFKADRNIFSNAYRERIKISNDEIIDIANIDIEVGSSIGTTYAQKMNRLDSKYDKGIITADEYKFAERNFGNLAPKENIYFADMDKAARNLFQIQNANPDTLQILLSSPDALLEYVDEFDNHDIHIEWFLGFKKSIEYESLLPEVKEVIKMYIRLCYELKKENMAITAMPQRPGINQTPKATEPGIPGRPPENINQYGYEGVQNA